MRLQRTGLARGQPGRYAAKLPTADAFDYMPTAVERKDETGILLTTNTRRVTFLREATRPANLIVANHLTARRRSGTRPMVGLKDFHSDGKIIAGMATMHMTQKGQWAGPQGQVMSAAKLFYSLACSISALPLALLLLSFTLAREASGFA